MTCRTASASLGLVGPANARWRVPLHFLALLLLMAALAACGGGDDPTPRPERATTQPEATEPGAITSPASGQATNPPTATTARPQATEDAEPGPTR